VGSPCVPSSPIEAVIATDAASGTGESTRSAMSALPEDPAGTLPTIKAQLVPAGAPSWHDQPGVEPAARNLACAGTRS